MDAGNVRLPSFCELISPRALLSSDALYSSAGSTSVTRWSVPSDNIQCLHLQHLLRATEHGKMVSPTLLPHFHPLAIRLAQPFVNHLILIYRIVLDITCILGTNSEAEASPL
jgi:hypothetical protein